MFSRGAMRWVHAFINIILRVEECKRTSLYICHIVLENPSFTHGR